MLGKIQRVDQMQAPLYESARAQQLINIIMGKLKRPVDFNQYWFPLLYSHLLYAWYSIGKIISINHVQYLFNTTTYGTKWLF